MSERFSQFCTAFEGHRLLLSGPLVDVALTVKTAMEREALDPLLVFDDATGRVIDLDLRGSKADIVSRLSPLLPQSVASSSSCGIPSSGPDVEDVAESRGRGRPKLGVIAREVTLLPRQWDWLAAQPGGASAVIRKLVDEAKRSGVAIRQRRADQEAAYHFMSAMAGDLPGFEEATRALFADDRSRLELHMSSWPKDIREYALRLAYSRSGGDTSRSDI
ncbi:DUF2239 family protein [Desulfolutivibrio sulfoxidireducens]|uniref:DUF2239 family protein n=1 Tax=Desulfolutivibrio sulfoxidireducens TaxID=2773299 RepID=UPI00159E75C8|nr:DUF2239 family protein [Desulfolutivibrio sulfoxidireducens]QLA15274.1 DUF2239 family protein [Desulfolutivibrio sulfoxidireducens]QLA18842.1 DUF2239 family protein [Desulfolutivibrio sulfoxidireducens]